MTRIAVISDIHANLEALDVVIAHIKSHSIDEVYCLGDIVGYGPNPIECIHKIREIVKPRLAINYDNEEEKEEPQLPIVLGNHDFKATQPKKSAEFEFNTVAKAMIDWTTQKLVLHPDHKQFLTDLPYTLGFSLNGRKIRLAHGDWISAEDFVYLNVTYGFEEDVDCNLDSMSDATLLFCGHSHYQETFLKNNIIQKPVSGKEYRLGSLKAIINVGSVGQSRDETGLACYAVFDTSKNCLTYYRLRYDYKTTIEKIQALPIKEEIKERLEERLTPK